MGGNAQIEEDSLHLFDVHPGQSGFHVGEIPLHQNRPVAEGRQTLPRFPERIPVGVDADQAAVRRRVPQDFKGVSPASQRAVHIDGPGPALKGSDDLSDQDRFVEDVHFMMPS